jgi:hypothetical protein
MTANSRLAALLATEKKAEALFGGAIADHIVGEFPHAHIPGDKDLYRISPANAERMRAPDA